MAGEALHSSLDQNTGLDTHQETTDEILSRLDDEAIASLAETGTVEDVRAVVEMLIEDNPELRAYLIEFQEANSAALAAELQRAAANNNLEAEGDDEVPEEEMHELIEQAQNYLYESLDIDENHANNGALTNFAKGIVDTLIFENGDLALQIIETKWGVILDALRQLATWSGIKWILQALWESIWDLFSGDAYEKWKAVADLGLVATWVWVAATVGRKAVRSAINTLDTPSPNNLDRALIDDISKLPDAERLEAAGIFLGRDISENQRQAILDAHNFWERLEDGSYSLWDLREKTKILRDAGLTSWEIRTLFDNNICGKEFPEFPNIYEDPRFDYLAEYRDILWDITEADIVWEGMNAITLRHPNKSDKLLKIAKPWDTDKLDIELRNHTAFRDFLLEQRENASWEMKEFLDKIEIPKVVKFDRRTGVYEMDRVDGNNFRVLKTLELQPELAQRLFPEWTDGMFDYQIEEAIRAEWWYVYPRDSSEYNEMQWDQPTWEFIVDMESQASRLHYAEFRKILNHFNSNWYVHWDWHWWNFMLWKDWKIYIIDFWRSRIPTE